MHKGLTLRPLARQCPSLAPQGCEPYLEANLSLVYEYGPYMGVGVYEAYIWVILRALHSFFCLRLRRAIHALTIYNLQLTTITTRTSC